MSHPTPVRAILLAGIASFTLAACGADDVASPGEGVIVLPAPTPTPTTPTPTTPTPTGVTPAADCPTIVGPNQLADLGTITGPQGTWRNCALPQRFTADTVLPYVPGLLYSFSGRVDVGTDQRADSTHTDVELTIDPGVTLFATTGTSFFVVNRGNKLHAVGTPDRPIVFTGRANVVGPVNDETSQLWGGVVLLGRAPVTDCLAPGAAPGTVDCERDTEGTSGALYGGARPNDNSGRMQYVQIRYSGYVLEKDSELQGLTPSGVGSETRLDHIQIHNSSDDGIEIFGGRPNLSHLVLTGNEDDSLDTDMGYKGAIQFVITAQRASAGDSLMEIDSNGNEDAVPRQDVAISNFTFIQRANAGNGAGILVRGGADYHFMNGVIVSPNLACLRINSATTIQTTGPDEKGPPKFDSVNMQCAGSGAFVGSGGVTAAQVQTLFTAGSGNSASFAPSLVSGFINGAAETARPVFDPTTVHSFFQPVDYVGAVKDANDSWYAGWTCNSATLNFGAASKSCTDIPVY